jgi:hypothetical protein
MDLNATFSASQFDDHYQMALIYCFDQDQNYCFSLSRFPDEDEIEVMVLDQVNRKVSDLSVILEGSILNILLDDKLAAQLDGHRSYTICLTGTDGSKMENLRNALRKIFEGKQGLRIED